MAREQTDKLEVYGRVRIEKGCKALGLAKNVWAKVLEIKEMGPEYNYNVSVLLYTLNGFNSGRQIALRARHINRLSDTVIRLSKADPTQYIEITRVRT